jgi:hypothetical protein
MANNADSCYLWRDGCLQFLTMVVVNGTPDNTSSHLFSTIQLTLPWSREHQAGNVKGTVAYSTSRA